MRTVLTATTVLLLAGVAIRVGAVRRLRLDGPSAGGWRPVHRATASCTRSMM